MSSAPRCTTTLEHERWTPTSMFVHLHSLNSIIRDSFYPTFLPHYFFAAAAGGGGGVAHPRGATAVPAGRRPDPGRMAHWAGT